ncbi:MAG: hypothetical protein Q9M75_03270, partial [Ghiorsea sp.]|nr:hypothetical protein [Ghiorsea sp.]
SFIERAVGGSTWYGYFAAQTHPWFVEGMWWRMVFGFVTAAGIVLLVWDLLTIGNSRKAKETLETSAQTAYILLSYP